MKLFKWLIALPLLAGCTTKIVKPDALAQVHRVAIVGLDLQQQKTVSIADLAGAASHSSGPSGATPALRVESDHIDPVYKDLAKKLNAEVGWKVMAEADVRKNPVYQQLFKDKTEGFQNRPMVNDRFVVFAPPGILDSFAIMTLKKEKLTALATALKVDAIVYASSTVNLNNNSMLASMVGKGEFKPSSNISLNVLDGRTADKIYWETATGPKVDEAAKNTLGMADDEKVNDLAQKATSLSAALVLKDLTVTRQ